MNERGNPGETAEPEPVSALIPSAARPSERPAAQKNPVAAIVILSEISGSGWGAAISGRAILAITGTALTLFWLLRLRTLHLSARKPLDVTAPLQAEDAQGATPPPQPATPPPSREAPANTKPTHSRT